MKVRNLGHINFSVVMDCFHKSFENYFVKMPTDHDYYKERWKMANVDFALSYGMFDKDELVGFLLNAVDIRNNELLAFNTGTGVLPEYRGQHVVDSIYEFAIPELRKNGIEKCTLEVIKDNIKALKVYERIGFAKTKTYKCFNGSINLETQSIFSNTKKVDADFFEWSSVNQDVYSWDNHIKTIKRGAYDFYAVLNNSTIVAYFIINPENGYLAQFDTFCNTNDNWIRLFTAIKGISGTIKINNVDESLTDKLHYLNHFGLKNTVDQFKMEMKL
ncbi:MULTISPECIES: GNAT family N-acetyltransferase [Flavobacteriaceae]|uniref:GNAT family N-acetyltransferase n=1 Tax=Flavobacteriaceae TaxID=49546 RepID=UPI00234B57A6|nr:GNAT family N-acetyltransferase [Muricauda sp. SP22]MDC6363622.1 GNAT family N-acetyltransferase [Muricauda sp. SP22]